MKEYPVVEVYPATARIGQRSKDVVNIWLIRYNGRVHEGGWAKEDTAYAYADKLVNGEVKPKLLPESVLE